ncbi:MAG: dihydroorotate dehydrogenase [Candidatus Neomarinimicrobiota bacterium]|nr:dihydroorotate dehydrogenase [Candidatus Neomarinimicrobiota bacterium]
MPKVSTSLGKVEFKNPVFVASGTYGYGNEISELIDINNLGAVVTKSITRYPREGNPPPRIVETSSGMLNSIGLANIGVEEYINKMIPEYNHMNTPIIMNIAGSSEEEYCEVMDLVESVSSNIIGYEINISCPNVKVGGMEFGVDCDLTERLTSKLRKRTERLLIMKLSPNVTDISSIARSAANGGADAVSAINTVVGMSINVQSMKSNIHYGFAGLSGPSIKPIGIASVYKIYQSVKIPIIGIGGITSSNDVLEYMMAGAFAVEIGTANYRDPGVGNNIVSDIRKFLDENNIESINEIIGSVKLGQ